MKHAIDLIKTNADAETLHSKITQMNFDNNIPVKSEVRPEPTDNNDDMHFALIFSPSGTKLQIRRGRRACAP